MFKSVSKCLKTVGNNIQHFQTGNNDCIHTSPNVPKCPVFFQKLGTRDIWGRQNRDIWGHLGTFGYILGHLGTNQFSIFSLILSFFSPK